MAETIKNTKKMYFPIFLLFKVCFIMCIKQQNDADLWDISDFCFVSNTHESVHNAKRKEKNPFGDLL